MTPAPGRRDGFWARHAIGLWLCGIGLLGLLQFHLHGAGLIAWLWLAGGVAVLGIGIALLVRQRRPR